MNLLVFTLNDLLEVGFLLPAGKKQLPFLQERKSASPGGGLDTYILAPSRQMLLVVNVENKIMCCSLLPMLSLQSS